MSFEIRFIPEAEETYKDLVNQLQNRWGDQFVGKFEAKVLKCINAISTSPYLYQIVDENTEIRKCLLHKNCSMYYKLNTDNIVIVCFCDNRQDPIF
jgi:hypothetical protein